MTVPVEVAILLTALIGVLAYALGRQQGVETENRRLSWQAYNTGAINFISGEGYRLRRIQKNDIDVDIRHENNDD